MFLFKVLFLINLFMNSLTYPSTERLSNDDLYEEPSYQEIFPIPIINFLKDNQFNNQSNSLSNELNNLPNDFNQSIDLHAIPSIKLDENSFIIFHTDHNQYLDLNRINTDNREKIFIITEFKDSFINNNSINLNETNLNSTNPTNQTNINNELSTFIKIQHQSNLNLSNINLSLSFSPFIAATTPPKLNTTTLNVNLTSLNSISTNKINSKINNLNLTSSLLINNTTTNNITIPKIASTSELISTNIEKPKDLAKNLQLNQTIRSTNQSIEEINLNKNQLNDELDNSTIQNNANYSSYGNDILNVNEFNKINPISLDLILDSLNDTITDDINLNTTTIG